MLLLMPLAAGITVGTGLDTGAAPDVVATGTSGTPQIRPGSTPRARSFRCSSVRPVELVVLPSGRVIPRLLSVQFAGVPVAASWDPALTTAMARLGVAVHEEAVLGDLLACLTSRAG